jgi:hypothetical protein
MKKKKQDKEPIYTLEITETQAKYLSFCCDRYSRLICGQDMGYRELMEDA